MSDIVVTSSQNMNLSDRLVQYNKDQAELSHANKVDVARAVKEVEAALIVAKAHPRDEMKALIAILDTCSRPNFAEKAIYRYRRGAESVEGPSIRMAETLARCYGNIEYGWREIERSWDKEKSCGKSVIEAFCWDLQTNTKRKIDFEILHLRDLKTGTKHLTSERDIYEHCANYASRRVRACILSLIPADIIEDAQERCRAAMNSDVKKNKLDAAKKLVLAFEEIGVSHDTLRRFLKTEKVSGASEQQIIDLRQIYVSIKEGHANVNEFFGDEPAVVTTSILAMKKEALAEAIRNVPQEILAKLPQDFAAKADASRSVIEIEKYNAILQEFLKEIKNETNPN